MKQVSAFKIYSCFLIIFLLVMYITFIDLTATWNNLKPDFLALFIIFWVWKQPLSIGLGVAFLCGLFYDLMSANYLGLHAGSLLFTAFLTIKLSGKFRLYSITQQVVLLMLLILSHHLMHYCYHLFLPQLPYNKTLWKTALASLVCWPMLYAGLNRIQVTWLK